MNRILLSIGLMAAASAGYAQPGTLDSTFGTAGKVIGDFGFSNRSTVGPIVIQPDGKLLVAGTMFYGLQGDRDFLVVRYNTDGTLDNNFDSDGWVTTNIGGILDYASSMVLQPDGKIVLAGSSGGGGTANTKTLVRYNSDGSLDMSFNGNGKVVTNEAGTFDVLALQADGKIVASGGTPTGPKTLSRFNADGTVDVGFNSGTPLTISFSPTAWVQGVSDVIVRSDGKLLVAGWVEDLVPNRWFGLIRVNPDGNSYDNTFGQGGIVTGNSYSNEDRFHKIELQPDGKILATGFARLSGSGSADVVVMRFNADGTRDNSFGINGVARAFTTPFTASAMNSIALQPDGRIVLSGSMFNGTQKDFAVFRFNPNGSTDSSFDGDGHVITPIGPNDDIGGGVALQADGKIVITGKEYDQNFVLVRYLGGDGVSVNEVPGNAGLKVYPNPGNGLFVVKTVKANVAYTVTDVNGRVVATGTTAKGQTTIDVTKNANGIYLLQIENEAVKLVKQ